jgi:hypothetical protein
MPYPLAVGGISVIVTPSVCRIVSVLPISQVGFPFSSSMMNRKPVPEVCAKALCVTPRVFRVSRMGRPISRDVHSRTGVVGPLAAKLQVNVPVRDHWLRGDLGASQNVPARKPCEQLRGNCRSSVPAPTPVLM